VALIPDCGHLPHVERPDRFVGIVRRFLADYADDIQYVSEVDSTRSPHVANGSDGA
jgi:hypothetical protein